MIAAYIILGFVFLVLIANSKWPTKVYGECSAKEGLCMRENCRDKYCCCDCHFKGGIHGTSSMGAM